MNLVNTLKLIQIVSAVAMMIAILLQNRGGGLSGVFGGTTNFYATKRGLEKKLFYSTIVIASVFFAVSLIIIIL